MLNIGKVHNGNSPTRLGPNREFKLTAGMQSNRKNSPHSPHCRAESREFASHFVEEYEGSLTKLEVAGGYIAHDQASAWGACPARILDGILCSHVSSHLIPVSPGCLTETSARSGGGYTGETFGPPHEHTIRLKLSPKPWQNNRLPQTNKSARFRCTWKCWKSLFLMKQTGADQFCPNV